MFNDIKFEDLFKFSFVHLILEMEFFWLGGGSFYGEFFVGTRHLHRLKILESFMGFLSQNFEVCVATTDWIRALDLQGKFWLPFSIDHFVGQQK
jgi:hypothetical protein